MSNVQFRMVKGEGEAHFQSSETPPEVQMALVKGMFAAMGVQEFPFIIRSEPASPFKEDVPAAPFSPPADVQAKEQVLKEKQKQELTIAKAQAAVTVAVEEKTENRMATSIAERLQAQSATRRPKWLTGDTEIIRKEDHITMDTEDDGEFDDNVHYVTEDKVIIPEGDDVPMHFKTGFKVDHFGNKSYKLRYWCPRCGFKSHTYVPEGTENVDCYNCHNTMTVHKAVPGTVLMEADAFKNWYVAGHQKPCRVISQAKYDKLIKRRGK